MRSRSSPGRRAQLLSPGAILSFHAVTSPSCPSNSVVNIPATQVMELIDATASFATIVPLKDLLERRQSGRSVRGMIALTFDDAYVSLNSLLADYLARRSVPVTLFVATAYSRAGEPFWWDRVDDLYPIVPPERWIELESAVGVPDDYRSTVLEFGPLRPLRQWILRGHLGRTSALLDTELSRLEAETKHATLQRPMTMEELESFCHQTGATIAPHTNTHPVLPLLASNEIESEIVGCFAELIDRFGASVVPALAAPFGLYDPSVVAIGKSAGICTLTLANTTLSAPPRDSAVPRLSMTVGVTRLRLLALLSGAREHFARLMRRRPALDYPALPGPTT